MRRVIQLTIGSEMKCMQIREFKGERVVTLRDIDELHRRVEGTAGRNFRENRTRLMDKKDFYEVDQPDEIRRLGLTRPQGGIPEKVILITETGYPMLVKSFTDDLSWEVQRELVNGYFRIKPVSLPMFSFTKIEREIRSTMNVYRLSGKSKQEAFRLAVLRVQEQTGADLTEFLPPEPKPEERSELDRIIDELIAYAKGPTIRPLPSQPPLSEPPEGWHGYWKNDRIVALYLSFLPKYLAMTLEIKRELTRSKMLLRGNGAYSQVVHDPRTKKVLRAFLIQIH